MPIYTPKPPQKAPQSEEDLNIFGLPVKVIKPASDPATPLLAAPPPVGGKAKGKANGTPGSTTAKAYPLTGFEAPPGASPVPVFTLDSLASAIGAGTVGGKVALKVGSQLDISLGPLPLPTVSGLSDVDVQAFHKEAEQTKQFFVAINNHVSSMDLPKHALDVLTGLPPHEVLAVAHDLSLLLLQELIETVATQLADKLTDD